MQEGVVFCPGIPKILLRSPNFCAILLTLQKTRMQGFPTVPKSAGAERFRRRKSIRKSKTKRRKET